jgi:hypothetical protein
MPRASLSVDWNVIRSLYLQGIPAKELAERFGINVTTLRARACKKGWNAIIGTEKERAKPITEKSIGVARDIWTERREAIRENIHTIGSRMTAYASQLPEDQLLAKADKVKIATEIAGKIVGLDRQEDKNQVNIAILSSYDDSLTRPSVTQSDTIEGVYSVGYTDHESVDTTTDPTRVGDDDPICP